MGCGGDCFDNAVAESFFATLTKELIPGGAAPGSLRLHRGQLQRDPPARHSRNALADTV
jgi:hypothetical protein